VGKVRCSGTFLDPCPYDGPDRGMIPPPLVGMQPRVPAEPRAWENKVLPVRQFGTGRGRLVGVVAMLTKWCSSTRLETRTKESNIYASIWVLNPDAQ
jgi:hypothetical protein